MDPAVQTGALPVIALFGLFSGWLLILLYNRLPEGWLQDYGYRPNDPAWPPARRIHSLTGQLLVAILVAAGFVVIVSTTGLTSGALILAVAFWVLVLATLPDALNKIIPDQAIILLALVGAAYAAHDLFQGRGIKEMVIDRLGGAFVAAGLLFLVGFIASALMRREAMGMGDVKLLFACGLMTGLRLVPLLYFCTFVVAALVFIPIVISQRNANETPPDPEEPVNGSDSPAQTDTRQIPLGPFIAAACFLCLVAGEVLTQVLFPYLSIL